MKKIVILTIAALFALSTISFAQGVVTGLTGKGVKLGVNLANATGDDAPDDASMKPGLVGGGFITYSFSDLFAVQPELLFSMKGAKSDIGSTEYKSTLSYIEIPVLFKVQLAGGGNFKPNFYAGPAVGFLMSAKTSADPEPTGWDDDIKDDMKSTDIGLIGGIGADLGMGTGPGKITFDLRYEVGLTSTSDVDMNQDGDKDKVNNSTISFLVGYGF
jgi:hypothetical protein